MCGLLLAVVWLGSSSAAAAIHLDDKNASLDIDVDAEPGSWLLLASADGEEPPGRIEDGEDKVDREEAWRRRRSLKNKRQAGRRRAQGRSGPSPWRELTGTIVGGGAGAVGRLVSLVALVLGSGVFAATTAGLSPFLGPAALLALAAAALVGQGLLSSLVFSGISSLVFGLFTDNYEPRFFSVWGATLGAELLASLTAVLTFSAMFGPVLAIDTSTVIGVLQVTLASVVSGFLAFVPAMVVMLVVPPILGTATLALTAAPAETKNAVTADETARFDRRAQTFAWGYQF